MSFWFGGDLSPDGVLTWNAPVWQISLALGLALLSIFVIWFSRRENPKNRRIEIILVTLAMSALVFALSEPTWVSEKGRTEKGRYAVLVDSSSSMNVREGEDLRSQKVQEIVDNIQKSVDGPVDLYGFTSSLSVGMPTKFDGGETDIGSTLSMIADRHLGQKLQGLALISDGIDRGTLRRMSNELSSKEFSNVVPKLPGPLTTYSVGRIQTLYDAAVVDVTTGGFAYVHTEFSLKAKIQGPPGERIEVGLYKDNKIVRTYKQKQKEIVELDKDGKATVEFTVRPKRVGRFAWEIRIPVDAKDAAPSNNSYPVVIKVVRDRLRVLQVSGSPSYDQKFLRLFLKQDPSVDLVSFFILRTEEDFGSGWSDHELSLIAFPYVQLFSEELDSFDLVVFQNFNYRPYFGWDAEDLLRNIADFVKDGNGLVMTGGDRSFDLGDYHNTPISEILPVHLGVSGDPASEEKFIPELNDGGINHPVTRLSANAQENIRIWNNLPKMDGFNKNNGLKKGAAALLVHPTEKTTSGKPMPILAVREVGKGRVMSIGVDSSWRWSFSEAVEGSGNQAYLRFWKNTLRWLVADPEDRRVVINPSRENALLGDEIKLTLKARDSAYSPVEGAQISGSVLSPDGERTEFSVQTGIHGEGMVPFTPKVRGTHYVNATYGTDSVQTVFAATDRDPELLDLMPDPAFLEKLANAYQGRAYIGGGSPVLDSSASRKVPQRTVAKLGTAPILAVWFSLLALMAWLVRRRSGGR